MRVMLALVLTGAPALAQEPGSLTADPSLVETCAAETPRGDVAPPCIGAAAKQCQQAPGGETTIGIVECVMGEHAAWDAVLNREYKAARAALKDEPAADSLLAAQRAWIAWRDAECGFQYDRYGGGSMRTIASANCQMSMTAMRALELRGLQGW